MLDQRILNFNGMPCQTEWSKGCSSCFKGAFKNPGSLVNLLKHFIGLNILHIYTYYVIVKHNNVSGS